MRTLKCLAAIFALACAGCDPPPAPKDPPPPAPVKTHSTLDIRVNEDGTSYFTLTMYSNARSPAEATQKAIRHLRDTLDGKVEEEEKQQK